MDVSRRIAAGLLAATLITSACGTLRPDADFTALQATTLSLGGNGVGAVSGGSIGGTVAQGGISPGTAGGPTLAPGRSGAVTGGADGRTGTGTGTAPAAGSTLPGALASGGGGGAEVNGASDVGVTATTIDIGNVTSVGGLAGPDQFPPYYFGAAAFFKDLNARGGINGRKVTFTTCDDGYTQNGNVKCVRDYVDNTKVFGFVSNACGVCDGLTYAADKGVPAIGGLATDFRSYALQHYWPAGGNPYPQNGKIGWNGKVYYGTGQFRFFAQKYGIKKAGIVYYDNAAPSKNAALGFAEQMKAEGIEPFLYGLNVALPQYDSAVLDMKSRGVTGVWDAIDVVGNQNLCKSIDSNGLALTAKVSNSAAWTQAVGRTFSSPCRKAIFSSEAPYSRPFSQTGNPEVAKFRAAMKRYFPDREDNLYQWTVDGWASAMWFTQAATACGAQLTRACLEKNMDTAPFTANGLWEARGNMKINFDTQKTIRQCTSIVQWDEPTGTFADRGDPDGNCYTTPLIGENLS